MGNLSYLFPTQSEEEILDFNKLWKTIQEHCPELIVMYDPCLDYIEIYVRKRSKKTLLVCNIYHNPSDEILYLLEDAELGVKQLSENGQQDEADSLNTFISINGLKKDYISISYGQDMTRRRDKVIRLIHSIGGCYLFDDGVHPSHIPPFFVFKRPILNIWRESMMWRKFHMYPWYKRIFSVAAFYVIAILGAIPFFIWIFFQQRKDKKLQEKWLKHKDSD